MKSWLTYLGAAYVGLLLQGAACGNYVPLPKEDGQAIAQMNAATVFRIDQKELDAFYATQNEALSKKHPTAEEREKQWHAENKACQAFLHAHQIKPKVLSDEQAKALRQLLLDPNNYFDGLFDGDDLVVCAVEFTFQRQLMTIQLGPVVSVIHGDQMDNGLLNDVGGKKLEEWLKAVGVEIPKN